MKIARRFVTALLAALLLVTPALAGAFTDVTQSTPYADAIDALFEMGVVSGYPDGTYRPDGSYTREEFAKLLFGLLAKQETVSLTKDPFADVAQDRWSAQAIAWAVETGAVQGRDDGLFWPQDTVTIEEAAKMLLVASGLSQKTLSFPDGYMNAACEAGLLEGLAQEVATRGSVAQMAWNTAQKLATSETLALGLGVQNGKLRVLKADGSTALLTPASGLSLPEKTAGVLFAYRATDAGLLLALTPAGELEDGTDAASLATQFSNISYELKLGNPDNPTVTAKVTADTVIYLQMGTADTVNGYTVIDRDDLPMINGGSGVSTCKVLTCVQKDGRAQALLVLAPGDLSQTGVYYGLLESASKVSDSGKSRYLLTVTAAGQELKLLTKATSGQTLFATSGSDDDYLMGGRSYVRLRVGEDGAVDQLVKLSETAQSNPRFVRGVVTALPGDGRGVSLSSDYTLEGETVVPGDDFYGETNVYSLHEDAVVYTVDAFPLDSVDGLLTLDDKTDVTSASVDSIGVSSKDGSVYYLADLLLVDTKEGTRAVAVFSYMG